MADIMVVDLADGWNPSNATPQQALFEANSRCTFFDKQDAQHSDGRFVIVYAASDNDGEPVEVSQQDFYQNTLSPVLQKARTLCGENAVLRKHSFDGQRLVFIFGK